MAVYTKLSKEDVEEFLSNYDIGSLRSFGEIKEGVSNTNYWFVANKTRYVLTLFEQEFDTGDLQYFVGLMQHLSAPKSDIRCPRPIADSGGKIIHTLKNKPALIVSFLEGFEPSQPFDALYLNPESGISHSETVAELLGNLCATLHVSAKDFVGYRANSLSINGWKKLWVKIGKKANDISPNLNVIIDNELEYLEKNFPSGLPEGAIHADLFPDNVSMIPAKDGNGLDLKGVIDFYYACNDMWMYDVAICINAWGFYHNEFDEGFVKFFLDIYHNEREKLGYKVEQKEWDALPILCRGAAMRFLLTRLRDKINQTDGATVTIKDPLEYANKLKFWQETDWKYDQTT